MIYSDQPDIDISGHADDSLSSEALEVIAPFLEISSGTLALQEKPEEIYELEVKSRTTKLLRSYYTPVNSNPGKYVLDVIEADLPNPQHLGSQFARSLQSAFLAENEEDGLQIFRSIPAATADQAAVLASSIPQFKIVKNAIESYLCTSDTSIRRVVEERFMTDSRNGHANRSAYGNNDAYQFKGRETARSLANLARQGLTVSVDSNGMAILQSALEVADEKNIALTELVKNWPILTICGFEGSKLSLAIHDTVDHAWTFAIVERAGLFSKFEDLFASIGSPQLTDIFKREGEMISSISFGSRYWEQQPGFIPLLNVNFIKEHFQKLASSGRLEARHSNAFLILKSLVPDTVEYDGLGFVFSNYLVTLHEQRRRYGTIKQIDTETGAVVGELNPLGLDYLAFMIELYQELSKPENNFRANIDSAHLLMEDFLRAVASGRVAPNSQLRIETTDMADRETASIQVPDNIIEWLMNNYMFSTIKEFTKS